MLASGDWPRGDELNLDMPLGRSQLGDKHEGESWAMPGEKEVGLGKRFNRGHRALRRKQSEALLRVLENALEPSVGRNWNGYKKNATSVD